MKILIATGIYPPDIGGPATNTKILAEEFSRLRHGVTVLTYADSEAVDGAPYPVVRVLRDGNIISRYARYFREALMLSRTMDAILVQGPVSAGLPVFLVKALTGRKYVLRVVGDHAWGQARQRSGVQDSLDDFQAKKYGLKVSVMKFVQSTVARAASSVVVPSEYLKKIVADWRVNESAVAVVYNSVEAEVPGESREELRKRLGMRGFTVVSIGRLVPWKGFSGLIRAFSRLPDRGADRGLVIIGDGPDRAELEMLVEELGQKGRVRMTGRLSRADTMSFLKAGDIFALNTGYEGLSHTVIEAMMSGVPVLTTNAGGNPEIVRDGETGLLVAHDDIEALTEAIKRLERDGGLRGKLAENALKKSDRFSKQRMVEGVFEQLNNH